MAGGPGRRGRRKDQPGSHEILICEPDARPRIRVSSVLQSLVNGGQADATALVLSAWT
jgi:hypothetical protein